MLHGSAVLRFRHPGTVAVTGKNQGTGPSLSTARGGRTSPAVPATYTSGESRPDSDRRLILCAFALRGFPGR